MTNKLTDLMPELAIIREVMKDQVVVHHIGTKAEVCVQSDGEMFCNTHNLPWGTCGDAQLYPSAIEDHVMRNAAPISKAPLSDEQLAAIERAIVARFNRTWPHWAAEAQVIWEALETISIFERKPGTDICDSCGIDRAETEALEKVAVSLAAEVERQMAAIANMVEKNTKLSAENESLTRELDDYRGCIHVMEQNDALRAENERLLDYYEQQGCDATIRENKRLREALEKIAREDYRGPRPGSIDIARAALLSKGE